jgi:hypothetical protein
MIGTSTNSTTITVRLPCDGPFQNGQPCVWREMHHYDDEGRHWCPTGFVFCHEHAGTGTITGPNVCQLWGESP